MTPETKPWYLSRTLWLNVATGFVSVATIISGQAFVANNPKLSASLAAAIALANVVLRLVTTKPIGA